MIGRRGVLANPALISMYTCLDTKNLSEPAICKMAFPCVKQSCSNFTVSPGTVLLRTH